ncbi:MAG: TetR family transcriptional regulator C-terminal domain-containing protein [Marivibrio sp.]|uniref:TetR family transcriptional regulator C-terminal domain-containing protein n=1 Tax=Marivibrio sp. TaxID=2039719 RepID=UPI0032ECF2B8
MPKEAQTAQRRRQLIEATIAVIAKQGLTGLRIADVAAVAGVSYGVVNFYFKSKDQLLADTLEHLAADYEEAAAEALAAAGPSAVDQLHAVIALDFSDRIAGRRQIAAWTAFWSESRANPAFRRRCVAVQDRFLAMCRRLMREALVETGRREDLDLLAAALNNLVTGLWVELQLRGATREARLEARRVCVAYLRALFPQAAPGDVEADEETAA